MTACHHWSERLTDHVLGLPAGTELQAHLGSCAACAAALEERRARVRQLDAGVRRLVAAEPSPYLASRVLARIESARPRRAGRWKAVLASLACAAVLAVCVYSVYAALEARREAERASAAARALARWRSPTEVLLRAPAGPFLNAVPRVGDFFFETKPGAYAPQREKGKT